MTRDPCWFIPPDHVQPRIRGWVAHSAAMDCATRAVESAAIYAATGDRTYLDDAADRYKRSMAYAGTAGRLLRAAT